MKNFLKYLLLVSICIISLFAVTGCDIEDETNVEYNTEEEYFTTITEWHDRPQHYSIVYANDTKVKYLIISGANRSAITPLYNSDGTLQIYEEE